ncbi:hypothetical protein SAMN06298216_3054 [Spirosomataceae bacterium TFI 002]|nr:hypothetical protein SAMN06298216_3054 [Spirosomataceae bacterium TFI 002]
MKNIIFLLFITQSLIYGQTVTWDGGAGTQNWEDPLNWSTNTLPCNTCNVVIEGDSVAINSKVNVKSVKVGLPSTVVTSILAVNAGFLVELNIINPTNSGLELNRGRFYNYASVNITGGGSGINGAVEVTNSFVFVNEGSIDINIFSGSYGLYIKQISKFIQNGTITIYNSINGMKIETNATNSGTIKIENCSGVGMYFHKNFTNSGYMKFKNQEIEIASVITPIPILQQFYNTPSGEIEISNSTLGIDGYDRVFLLNEGIITLDKMNKLGELYQIQNDNLITINNYTEGFEIMKFINNGGMTFSNSNNSKGIAITGKEFTNYGNIHVNHAIQAFKTAANYTGSLAVPINQFDNYGDFIISNVQYGIELEKVPLQNFQTGVIKVDTFQFKALKATGETTFNNNGILEFYHQFQEDTTMVLALTTPGAYGTTTGSEISIKKVFKGLAINTITNTTEDYFDNSGTIVIDTVFKSPDNKWGSFGLAKMGTGKFTNNGAISISNVKGLGMLIDTTSNNGVDFKGSFTGKNNSISILNNSRLSGNLNKFRVFTGGVIYSRGDSLYSILDSSITSMGTVNCGVIDVVNIKKVNDIFTVNGMVKLTGPGSNFNLYAVKGLLIDPFGDIYPNVSAFNKSNIDMSYGIGGNTSNNLTEMNFLMLDGYKDNSFSSFFLDSALTISAGTFNSATGSFIPSFSSQSATELYFEYASSTCSYFGSIPVMDNTCPYETIENEFLGTVSNDWHNPENWSLKVVPNICHKVKIPSNKRSIISTNRKARAAGIETLNGAVWDTEAGSVLDIIPTF